MPDISFQVADDLTVEVRDGKIMIFSGWEDAAVCHEYGDCIELTPDLAWRLINALREAWIHV